jgi:hypothetical protein
VLGVDWEMVKNSSGSQSDVFDKIVSLLSSVSCFFMLFFFSKVYSILSIAPNLPRALVFENNPAGPGLWWVGCMTCHRNFIDDAKCSKNQGS